MNEARIPRENFPPGAFLPNVESCDGCGRFAEGDIKQLLQSLQCHKEECRNDAVRQLDDMCACDETRNTTQNVLDAASTLCQQQRDANLALRFIGELMRLREIGITLSLVSLTCLSISIAQGLMDLNREGRLNLPNAANAVARPVIAEYFAPILNIYDEYVNQDGFPKQARNHVQGFRHCVEQNDLNGCHDGLREIKNVLTAHRYAQ